jgi:hypothetical protein
MFAVAFTAHLFVVDMRTTQRPPQEGSYGLLSPRYPTFSYAIQESLLFIVESTIRRMEPSHHTEAAGIGPRRTPG